MSGTRTGCRDIGRTVVAVRVTMHQTGVSADVVGINYGSVPEVGEGKMKRQGSRPTKGNSAPETCLEWNGAKSSEKAEGANVNSLPRGLQRTQQKERPKRPSLGRGKSRLGVRAGALHFQFVPSSILHWHPPRPLWRGLGLRSNGPSGQCTPHHRVPKGVASSSHCWSGLQR